jgi:hypothetical protein
MNTPTCIHHLFGGPLVCIRTDAHATGHVYASQAGSYVPDRHGEEAFG